MERKEETCVRRKQREKGGLKKTISELSFLYISIMHKKKWVLHTRHGTLRKGQWKTKRWRGYGKVEGGKEGGGEEGMKIERCRGKWHAWMGGKRQMAGRRAKRPAKMKMRKRQAALMKEELRVAMFTDLRRYKPPQLIGLKEHRCSHSALDPCLPPHFLCLLWQPRS